jgi:zinc protease
MSIPLAPETIKRVTLKNGIIVLVYENRASPAVVLRGHVRAGSMFDPKDKPGVAIFTADMLDRGTTTRSFQDIAAQTERVGAAVGFGAGVHLVGFNAKGLSEDLPLLLDIVSDCLQQPTFPSAEVEKVRGELLTSIREREDSTSAMAGLAFRKLAYPNHPYGRDGLGTLETMKRIARADLKQFYTRTYQPTGVVIAIVGDVRAAEAIAHVEKFFGRWQVKNDALTWTVPPVKPLTKFQRKRITMKNKVQADLVLGAPALPRTHPDYLAAEMADVILGEFGLMGRLGDKVRDQLGLAYYARSSLESAPQAGAWTAYAGVNPHNVDKTVEAILFELNRLKQEPVSETELDDAKAYVTGTLPLRLESNDGIAHSLLDMEFYQLGLDYLQRWPDMVRALTPAQLQAAAQKYLNTKHYALVVAGP